MQSPGLGWLLSKPIWRLAMLGPGHRGKAGQIKAGEVNEIYTTRFMLYSGHGAQWQI